MDVVRVVADSLGGAVRVQSEIGRGTTVLLDLPLSLALLRVVLIEVNGESHRDSDRGDPAHRARPARDDQAGQMAEIEGETIPIAALTALLGQPASAAPEAGHTVLIIEARDGRMGVLVDAVLEEQELVFQELRGPLGDQLTIAGAALLGNGDIVPILDVQALYERIVQAAGTEIAVTSPPPPVRRAASSVLVVEDSLVAAEMHRGILSGAGYDVEIAHDGVEALEVLRRGDWDLVITDVDMPNMDGFELTAHLRADPRLRDCR